MSNIFILQASCWPPHAASGESKDIYERCLVEVARVELLLCKAWKLCVQTWLLKKVVKILKLIVQVL